MIIAANELRAREIAEDYRMFDREVMYYPAKDVIFFSADVHGNALSTQRLKVREALLDREGGNHCHLDRCRHGVRTIAKDL